MSLFGQIATIPDGEFGDRPRQRIWAVQKAAEITMERVAHEQYRPIGIPYLAHICIEDMKRARTSWPNIPAQDGIRRRIQECADPANFSPVPLIHLPIKFKDIDPEASSSVYEVQMRPTSCYLLNPFWVNENPEMEVQMFLDAKDLAFAVLRVQSMDGLRAAFAEALLR